MKLKEVSLMSKIGWIGTGVMGFQMAQHLIKAGHKLLVYNRTRQKANDLIQLGANFLSPNQIAKECDILFLMVGYPKDVEEIILTKDQIINDLKQGSILIDHTTSSASLSKSIFEKCLKKNIYALDAPVSGGDIGAKNGNLTIMVGGDKNIFDNVFPLFQKYGKNIKYQGEAGTGQHAKMANQIAITTQLLGVCEAFVYGYKAGLNLQNLLDTISQGAAGSFSMNVYGPRMLNRNFEPGFFVKHFVKDMRIALEECQRMNISLPGLALVHQLYTILVANGGQEKGTHALLLTLEQFNNLQLKQSFKQEKSKL